MRGLVQNLKVEGNQGESENEMMESMTGEVRKEWQQQKCDNGFQKINASGNLGKRFLNKYKRIINLVSGQLAISRIHNSKNRCGRKVTIYKHVYIYVIAWKMFSDLMLKRNYTIKNGNKNVQIRIRLKD